MSCLNEPPVLPDVNGEIVTYTGRYFNVFRPRAGDVNITDIAHSLAMQCRFVGHCKYFYSVAQHSLRAVQENRDVPLHLQKWLLMHDAAEAYLSDISRPVKKLIPQLGEIEDRVMRVIQQAFCLPDLTDDEQHFIHEVDMRLLATERRDLIADADRRWACLDGYPPYKNVIEVEDSSAVADQFLFEAVHLNLAF